MTISEQSRHAMFVKLESVLGEEAALTLMEHLPPVGWADVATKRDLDQLHTLTQRDIALATAEMSGETHQLGAELRGEMHQLGTDLRAAMGQLGTDLRAEISQGTAAQTRALIFTVLGSLATMGGLTLAAARLG